MNVKEKYIIDEEGRKVGVLMEAKEYQKLLEYIEYIVFDLHYVLF